ncbi:MAG: hypothetical protein J6B47_04925 [Prevotella sp.]|nr:hypothetical protein [Prevotella sp.]
MQCSPEYRQKESSVALQGAVSARRAQWILSMSGDVNKANGLEPYTEGFE